MEVVIFNYQNNVCILSPILESGLSIEEIADKDVPPIVEWIGEGDDAVKVEMPRPYWIVDDSELPDRALRYQWAIVDGKVVIDSTKPLPPLPPNWQVLYDRLLGSDLKPIFASLKDAAKINAAINWDLTQITFAITQTQNEQALRVCLDELIEDGYVVSDEHKALWNQAIAELNFSELVRL